MKTSNRIVVLSLSLATALSAVSCSGIVLSDIVNNRAVQKGVGDFKSKGGGDRTIWLEWTPPEKCSVASYRIVNETTEEEFSVSGASAAYSVPVPRNEALYLFSIYAVDSAGMTSKCQTAYGSTYRDPRSIVCYKITDEKVTRCDYEDFIIDETTGKPTSSVKGSYSTIFNPPVNTTTQSQHTITTGKEDPTGSSTYSYDEDGNETACIVYNGVAADRTVESAVRTEYDSSSNWIKKSTYKVGDVLDYYETAERSSSGAIERKNRYGSDNSLIFYQYYTYNTDGSTHDYYRYNPENELEKSCIYTYDAEGKLTLMDYPSWSIECQYYTDTGDVQYQIERYKPSSGEAYLDCAYEYFY